ncbi:MAG: DEAD/DEAH box helicase [Nitrosomonadales bacterium]|nr:DEAD/DEAH box helicase [Nitrosomonadales bacterium]
MLWTPHTRSALYNLLRKLNFKHRTGRFITQEEVKHASQQLLREHKIVESSKQMGYYRLAPSLRNPMYEELLSTCEAHLLRTALFDILDYRPEFRLYSWPIYDRNATIAIVRLALMTRTSKTEIERMAHLIGLSMDWLSIVQAALLHDFSALAFARIDPALRWDITYHAVVDFSGEWNLELRPLIDTTLAQIESNRDAMPTHLRLALAELLLHRGECDAALALVDGVGGSAAGVFNAYALAQQGAWAEAQILFETAIKQRQIEIGSKKRIFPLSLGWIYPLILLAQQTPKHLELARKYCIAESGKRDPDSSSGWGLWVHAIDIRRGDAELDPALIKAAQYYENHISLDHLWRVLLAAWLGVDERRGATKAYRNSLSNMAQHLAQHLKECGLLWLSGMAAGAKNLINDEEPPAHFFVAGKTEHWRELLSALQALGSEAPAPSSTGSETSRLIWLIEIGDQGALEGIEAMEQKHGARGWGKAKAISLSKISGNPHLTPWDAKVANCIRTSKYNRRNISLDLPAALQALIGHPALALSSAPEQFIELNEGTPEIEVIHKGDKITLKVTPPLRDAPASDQYYFDADEKREAEALRLITLVQDSSQRVRLIRFTPSQRRAAQLLSDKVSIPASAQKELQTAMQALSSHFQLQADHLQAAREVATESRLRAELSPLNDGLLLRLVVTPLGSEGPRLVPGHGRRRLMALVGGESMGTTRQLDVERTHLGTVLDALPFLESCAGDSKQCEWDVAEPEDALALVELLPALPAIAALDWPKGKAVSVIPVDMSQLAVKVKSERDWFKLEGEARVDEGLVFTFEQLLEASRSSSRFIAMGNGVYAALTRRLKDRLSDLASVTETDKHGSHIPRLAAAWMDDALEGISTTSDAEFRDAIEKLRSTQDQAIPLPKTLQAELRPYQEDGYLWAARLAQAGLGACLADDMGLGKTLQSLALLLARAEHGPALIIAPTSVCGNWVAEAARFAPSLNLHLYSEADRATVINDAAAFDVVVASYNLVQQAGEQFAAKHWHTLIADEAQAIKNASTKRSQAVFELKADFRLALSGTPVENRLAELWAIMRFVNPGLLGSLTRFNERFATPIERDKDRDAQHILRRLISPFLLRRTKTQVLQELPPRTELVIKIAPSTEEAAHYEALRRQAVAEADAALSNGRGGQAHMNVLAQLTRLRRAACDPRIITPSFPAIGSKVQTFTSLAIELVANGHKALVFSQFVDFLALLREALDAADISYQYLDGATPAAERTKRVAAFQAGNCDLFLISLKAGGFGLNLTAADYVVITDPWWNPAAEDQAMGRAHRMGQLRPVTVYRLVTQGTVEEHIVGLHNDKRALAESILSEGEAVSIPSTEELISLIKGD